MNRSTKDRRFPTRRYNIIGIRETKDTFEITSRIPYKFSECRHCGSDHVVKYGSIKEKIMDIPITRKHTHIILYRRRLLCVDCRSTFLEYVPDKDKKRRMTKRLLKFIKAQSLKYTAYRIAKKVGVDEKTIRNIISELYE